jgi:kynureninase
MTTLDHARALDATDPLARFRERFRLPEEVIYLDGNSLGPLPRATAARLGDVIAREWGEGLIRSWNDAGWVSAPRRVGDKIARLIGADPGEVIVADSTSVCLFKLLSAAAGLRQGSILAESDGFPTDAHIAASAASLLGRDSRAAAGAAMEDAFTPDVAAAVLCHVDYRTARRHDMAAVTAAAARNGVRIVWDLSHSAGAVPLDLKTDGVELAVGCGYKYLNGGPGAPAFLYVSHDLQPLLAPTIGGWWGHATPFSFETGFRAAPGITRFLSGTPPVLGLLSLESGIDLMLEVDPRALWEKSVRLYDLFASLVSARCPALRIVSPADPAQRGSHIALAHPHAFAIVQALIARGVIGDFRTPDIARFGLTPLTLRYTDVWHAVDALAAVIDSGEWRAERFATGGVVP